MKLSDTRENVDKAEIQLDAFPPFFQLLVEIVKSGGTFPTAKIATFPRCVDASVDSPGVYRFNKDRVQSFDASLSSVIQTEKASVVSIR